MSTKKEFSQHDITQAKHILRVAYSLEDVGVDPECITRMCIFVATCFAMNHQISAEEYKKIIEQTWSEMLEAVGDDAFEIVTDNVDPETWIGRPITDDEQ